MSQFNVTELDFDLIKQSTIDYFKSNAKYTDWNFEGSGLSVLMDVLAYNTHYNAMLAHLSLNETFLDSAQLRGNVVSHAKLLGYVPRSDVASTAVVDIVVPAPMIDPPSTITLARGTRFTATVSSVRYTFVNLNPIEAVLDTVNNRYKFSNVNLKEGILKRMLYVVDNLVTNQKFTLPDTNIDNKTLRVRVKSNAESNDYSIYTQFTTLINVTGSSQIYFIQENSQSQYEIYFGDDNLGVMPINNQVVEAEYIYTNGSVANGASAYTAVDAIGGQSNVTVTASVDPVTSKTILSYGGAPRETVESIRYNAPLTFITQNRAVTADDYRAIILQNVGNIQAISVWGGEHQTIPDYGKVYIAIKPTGSNTLNDAEKANVISILKGKNVVSITPVVVDPEYTFLSLTVNFKYNPNLTDRTNFELVSLVRSTITQYNADNLEKFDGVFRSSQLLRAIDDSDPSVLNSDVNVLMYKDITAYAASSNNYDLQFTSPIFKSSSNNFVISSDTFLVNGVSHYFGDTPIDGSSNRTVSLYKTVNQTATRVIDVGTIYTVEGRIVIQNFRPDADSVIRISVVPESNDLAPKRNQLIAIDPLSVSIAGEIDTIAVSGSTGAMNYKTPSRGA